MLENSIKKIIPMVQSFYKDDYERIKVYLTETAIFSSEVLADALHTSFCIAYNKFEEKDIKKLGIAEVNKFTPYKWTGWAPYPYFYPVIRNSNMSLDKKFKPVSLKLKINGKVKEIKKGFGVGAPFQITFILPKKVYKKFCCFIGLDSELGKGGEVIFKVDRYEKGKKI